MIKLLIFDLDGTLVDAYPAVSQSVNFTLRTLGLPQRNSNEIKRAVGWGDRQLLVQFVGEENADKALAIYRPHHTKVLRSKGRVRFLPGALDALKLFKRHDYLLAIASNRPTAFTQIILEVLGIDKLFDAVLCADKSKPKPAPDMLRTIIEQLKLSKKEVIYVGDMTIDVETGANAGVATVAVVTGSSTRKELNDLKPYRIISRISALKSVVQKSNSLLELQK